MFARKELHSSEKEQERQEKGEEWCKDWRRQERDKPVRIWLCKDQKVSLESDTHLFHKDTAAFYSTIQNIEMLGQLL